MEQRVFFKNRRKIFSFVLLIWILSSCTNSSDLTSTNTKNNVQEDNVITNVVTSNSSDELLVQSDLDSGGELTISDKCIGCGHCVRFAPSNFSFNSSTHKAEVISQENLDSSGVQQAINRCHARAISIG